MDKILRLCEDGSHTLFSEKVGECYHSIHGAYHESLHIFIDTGFRAVLKNLEIKRIGSEEEQKLHFNSDTDDSNQKMSNPDIKTNSGTIKILEVGFGTGLNALLTAMEADKGKISVSYLGLEPFPVNPVIVQQLNYCTILSGNSNFIFTAMHDSAWETSVKINSCFNFEKKQIGFMDVVLQNNDFDLIYFDAFSPEAQPDLWEQAVFEKCFKILAQNGVLVTYCAKGRVKRALKSAGFTVENLPGPPGKREITRAHKLI